MMKVIDKIKQIDEERSYLRTIGFAGSAGNCTARIDKILKLNNLPTFVYINTLISNMKLDSGVMNYRIISKNIIERISDQINIDNMIKHGIPLESKYDLNGVSMEGGRIYHKKRSLGQSYIDRQTYEI